MKKILLLSLFISTLAVADNYCEGFNIKSQKYAQLSEALVSETFKPKIMKSITYSNLAILNFEKYKDCKDKLKKNKD